MNQESLVCAEGGISSLKLHYSGKHNSTNSSQNTRKTVGLLVDEKRHKISELQVWKSLYLVT